MKSQCRELNSRPLPYQGNALPLSYIGNCKKKRKRARDQVRTGDIQLGRLTLYQLSYSRNIYLDTIKIMKKLKERETRFELATFSLEG